MITHLNLPLLASDLTDTPKVPVTRERFFLAVAVLTDFGIAVWGMAIELTRRTRQAS